MFARTTAGREIFTKASRKYSNRKGRSKPTTFISCGQIVNIGPKRRQAECENLRRTTSIAVGNAQFYNRPSISTTAKSTTSSMRSEYPPTIVSNIVDKNKSNEDDDMFSVRTRHTQYKSQQSCTSQTVEVEKMQPTMPNRYFNRTLEILRVIIRHILTTLCSIVSNAS